MDSTMELSYEEKADASLGATCVDADSKDAEESDDTDYEDILSSSDDEDDLAEESRPKNLSLRKYQKELAKQALDGENSLIIAPTGSGKTAVANWIIKKHLQSGKARSIIFLVSKTTLARQQYDFFSRHLSENLKEDQIAYLIGEIAANTDVGAIIKSMKLVVLTPQILIEELDRQKSFISFDHISMMIFDECHNATKKHPYKVLMDMMLDYKADHPKYSIQIVGMTASPGVGKGNTRGQVLENLTTLLANLDVKLGPAVVVKNLDELKMFQNEIDKSYIRVRIGYDRFSRKIQKAMQLIEKKLTDLGAYSSDSNKPPASRTMQVYENWVVSLMNHPIKLKLENSDKSRDTISYAEHLKMYYNLLYLKNLIPNAIEYTNTLAEFDQAGKVGSFLRTISSKLEKISMNAKVPLLIKLFDVLKEEFQKNANSRCIIFVSQKLIALPLVNCIRDNRDLKHLEPEYVTGAADPEIWGMTKTQLESNIRAFRDGKCKVLIATSAAEEGLDINTCNLVIMYNYVTGEVGRIQRAGRGKAENSRSILITPQGSEQIQKKKTNSICADATEQALQDLEELLPEDRIHKIKQIQIIQRNKRLDDTSKRKQQVDEASKWKILCGKCKAYITKADMLRQINNQHKFVIDPEFPSRVKKTDCKPRVLVSGWYTQIATFTCKNAECMYYLGLEMQYKGNTYPTLKAEQLIFEDDNGDIKAAKKWNKCPFANKEEMDNFYEDEKMDSQMIKEFVIAQRKPIAKGFSPDDISEDERFEILAMANSP